MNEIKVMLVYPAEFEPQTKELMLNEIELNALMLSNKVGSEGKYFFIEEKIFEDCKDGKCVTIILESSK